MTGLRRRRGNGISIFASYGELLLFILFLYYFGCFNIFSIGNATPANLADDSGNLFTQLYFLFLFFNSIFLLGKMRVRLSDVWRAIIPALPLLFWAILSVLWSQFPDLTVRRAGRLFVEFGTLTFLVMSIGDATRVLRVLILATFLVIGLDFFVAVFVPASFTAIGFAGVHGTKNSAGAIYYLAMGLLFVGAFSPSMSLTIRLTSRLLIPLVLFLMILSLSKTPAAITLFSAFVVLTARRFLSIPISQRAVAVVGGIFGVTLVGILIYIWGDFFLTVVFGDASFTGRTTIWQFVLNQYGRSPVIGLGYGALWQSGNWINVVLENSRLSWIMNEAHNGYLEILVQLGAVGVGFLLLYLLLLGKRIFRWAVVERRPDLGFVSAYALYIFWGALFYNFTESDFFRSGHSVYVQLVIIAALHAQNVPYGRLRK